MRLAGPLEVGSFDILLRSGTQDLGLRHLLPLSALSQITPAFIVYFVMIPPSKGFVHAIPSAVHTFPCPSSSY